MSAPLSAIIEGDLTEVVIEEERIVLELWAGFSSGGGESGDAISIQQIPVSEVDPLAGQALVYSGTQYVATDVATQAELDAGLALKADVIHTHTFASLTSKPTTLAGYGITDAALAADLSAHVADTGNPHAVTAAQVGAYTTAQVNALDAALAADIVTVGSALTTHAARVDNPHAVTKAQVGLADVENTALSTWAGSANIVTVGTIATGVWNATAITWAKVNKAGSSLADLATRSASDLSSGNLPYAQLPTGTGTWAIAGDLSITGGSVLLGAGTSITVAGAARTLQHSQSGGSASSSFARFQANAAGYTLFFVKSRNATVGTNTIVATSDTLGSLNFVGADGVDFATEAAQLQVVVVGTPAASRVAAQINLRVAAGVADDDIATRVSVTATALTVAAGVMLYVNDTSNASMTQGLTINQGAADDEILALKSSDVAHPFTGLAENDTYGTLRKAEATAGGLMVSGFKDSDGAAGAALFLRGHLGEAADTTKSTAGIGVVIVDALITSGTGGTVVGADGNLMVLRNNTTTRFIWDAEGDAHADVSWTTFDRHHDLAVIEDMETLLAPGQVQRRFGRVVHHDRAFFEREGLLHDVRDVGAGRVRGMLNTTRATMLAFGAIREVGGRQQKLESAIRELIALNPQMNGAGRALALLEA